MQYNQRQTCQHHGHPTTLVLRYSYGAVTIEEPACLECVNAEAYTLDRGVLHRPFTVAPMPECEVCHAKLVTGRHEVTKGRPARYCDANCKKKAQRKLQTARETGIYR